MGKKNKKKIKFDFYENDISVEEQRANAELFDELENGEASILDVLNYKGPNAPISQSGFTRQIESACFDMKPVIDDESEDDSHIEYENTVSECIQRKPNYDETTNEYVEECVESLDDETEEVYDVTDEIIENDNTSKYRVPQIHCTYNHMTGRVIIDDEAIPTVISPIYTATIETDPEFIPTDPDEFSTLISRIFFYIISRKHPTVIVSEETFEIKFSIFANIESDRFIFFRNNGFVFVYVLDEDMRDTFYGVKDVYNMDDETFLRYLVGTAFISNNMHNVFMYNDEDEFDCVMEERHNINELIAYIEQNADVEYAGHNSSSGNVMTRLHVFNMDKFVNDVRNTLEDLILTDDDEDDENEYDYEKIEEDGDDITEEEMDDDIDVTDYPDDDDMMTNTDDIDQLFEEMESSDNIASSALATKVEETTVEKVATVDSSKNDSMVMPIIRRR